MINHEQQIKLLLGCFVALLVELSLGQAAFASVVLSEEALIFSAFESGDAPSSQSFSISSSDQSLPFSLRVNGASWISAGPINGSTPARIQVSIDQTGLKAGTYMASIVVSVSGIADEAVAVELTVTSGAPILASSPGFLRFQALQGSSDPSAQGFFIHNVGGGGPLAFKVSVATDSPWLTVVQEFSETRLNIPTPVKVLAHTTGLKVGVYRGLVHIDSKAGPADIPVSLVVNTVGPVLGLNFNGLVFESREGNGNSNTRNVLVLNLGTGTVNWQSELLSGKEWLTLSSGSARGQATPEAASRLSLSANPGSLAPGSYYALIRISDASALDSPQYFTAVLHVTSADLPPTPDLSPQGLFFVSESGTISPAQPVRLFTSSLTPVPFQASASTTDGAGWLLLDHTSGVTSTQETATLSVRADASMLAPGIYTGDVTVALPGSEIRTTNVTMVVPPRTLASLSKDRSAAGCQPSALSLTQTGLVNGFSAPAGWPETLIIRLADNCGDPVLNAQVAANFSNGDPALPLKLTNPQVGLYSATWSPSTPASQVRIMAMATAADLGTEITITLGKVTPNLAPTLSLNGVLSNANPAPGAALAPGAIAQVKGAGLANSNVEAQGSPLPIVLDEVRVLIGARETPIFSVSSGQLKVQIPIEVEPNRYHSVVVSVNDAYSTPETFTVAPAQPAIATYSEAWAIEQSRDSTPISVASPAHPGDQIIIFLEGMGATTPPTASGYAAAGEARVQLQPNVIIGGKTAEISYAGLTPGLIGVYQINLRIPPDLTPGDLAVAVTQNGVTSNSAILPVR